MTTPDDPIHDEDPIIENVRNWVSDAGQIAILTGAGISTDSGIPDFRGPQGLWTRNPEAEKMATLQVYLADPEVPEHIPLNKKDISDMMKKHNATKNQLPKMLENDPVACYYGMK